MKWPWQKQPERSVPPVDVQALVRQAVTEAATLARQEIGEEISRVLVSSSPMAGLADPNAKSPLPLYAWDNPLYFSTPQAPTRRPGAIVTIQTLRQLADTYDVLRSCINHIKDEVFAVPLEIVARDSKDKSASTKAAIQTATEWFGKKGGLGGAGKRRRHFESEMIEDLAVIGASAVYHGPSRGGKVIGTSVNIDSATIRPVVDAYGWTGQYPYEQWILGLKVASFTHDEMTYDGLFPKSYSPYFWSPVEWLVFTVNRALRSDGWNEAWLTDGNTPADVFAMPETWTPDMVKSWAQYWDAMFAGDSKARQKSKFVPGGTQRVGNNSRKDQDFQEYELWLLRRTCAIMSVHPAAIGFVGEQYAVTQENSMDATSEFGVGKYLTFRKDFYDDELERIGFPELEAVNVVAKQDNAKEKAERNVIKVAGGTMTINEARQDEGQEPVMDGDVTLVPISLRPLEQALVAPPDPIELAKATAEAKNVGTVPGKAASGNVSNSGKGNGAKRAALSQWERKAINRFRDKQNADTSFETDAIPQGIMSHIETRLAGCTSVEAVRSLFREAATIEPDEASDRTEWAERVARELEALSEVTT